MVVSVYSSTLAEKTRLTLITDYHYKKFYYNIGSFSLTVLDRDEGSPRRKVSEGDMLYVWDDDNGDDYLVVTSKKYDNGCWILSGYDCKFILTYRCSLFPTEDLEAGTYGYDCRKGYTGDILKEYIDYNLCEASDADRKIDLCYCTTEGNIGFPEDTYMSRLEHLDEIAEKLCAPSGIGYDVYIDTTQGKIGIRIYKGTDRTNGGYAFGTYFGDGSMSIVTDNSAEKTTIWAVNGTDANNSTVTAFNVSSATGLDRKEGVVTLNCETEEVEVYAKKAAEDMVATEEYDITASTEGYLKHYNIGDVTMCIGTEVGQVAARIMFVEKNYSGDSKRIKVGLTAYEKPVKPRKALNKFSSEIKKLSKEVIDQKLNGGGTDSGESNVVIENANFIKESDLKYVLHNYSEVDFVQGNKIMYGGQQNQIIAQGIIIHRAGSKTLNGINVPVVNGATTTDSETGTPAIQWYSSMDFPIPLYESSWKVRVAKMYFKYQYSSSGTYGSDTYNLAHVLDTGEEKLSSIEYVNYNAYGGFGFAFAWDSIRPPGSTVGGHTFEYGYALCHRVSRLMNKSLKYSVSAGSATYYIPFGSLAEYHAAIALTYEPQTLTQVEETTTEV